MRAPLAATLRCSFAALLLLASAAAGLDPRTAITQYGHTAWRVRDGYFAGAPSAIAQTTDGFLWIGTDAGLIRFDGVRFLPFEPPAGSRLPDERIVSLLGARDGSLWIGTGNGLVRWDGSRLVVYAKAGRFGALIEDRRGTVWAGHTRALQEVPPLCRFESGRFQCFRFTDKAKIRYVGSLHEDRRGEIWIGGEAGVCRWRPQTPDDPECHEVPALAPLAGKSAVYAIAEDGGLGGVDNLWVSTGLAGVWHFAAGRWTSYPGPPGTVLDSSAILSDHGSGLWIASLSHGITRLVQGRTEHFTHADGLSGESADGIFEDREGSVWVASGSGLDRFRDVKVATLTMREGLPEDYTEAVVADREGGVWVAQRHGLIHLGTAGMPVYRADQELPRSGLSSLLKDSRGRLWVGVGNGLAWWEDGRFFPFTMPDGSVLGLVRAIVEDRQGDVWIATTEPKHVLVRLHGDRIAKVFSTGHTGGRQITVLAADPQEGVWIGAEHLLLRSAGDGGFKSYGGVGALDSGFIDGLLPDARGLWVATSRGLGLLRNGRTNVLDVHGGLPCDDIGSLVAGGDGSLWLKSPCGLIQIPAGELDAWADHPERHVRVRLLDVFDGVQTGLPPFTPRAARSLDGLLWFPLEEAGLQVVDPKSLKDNTIPPPVKILRAVADRKAYPTGAGLRLPPLTRDIEIDYTALSLSVPEKVRFRYRLEGADAGWQDAGTRREAFYSNLRPGTYRFRVVACNNDGVWSPEGAALDLTIRPAFYQTRTFLVLSAALLAGLTWSAYRWRVHQVRASLARRFEERLAERTRIAQDLHDTLLQGFLSASLQLYAAVEELPAPARSRFERVQQLIRQVIDEGRGALRGLRSADQGADDLETALARVPGELGPREGVDFRIVTEGRTRPLLPVVRDEIYRIAREALVNAFRHAGADTIEVEIEYAPRQLRVMVRDDGGGIDEGVLKAGRDGHWGLSGMRERAERIGARLHVWSRAGSGTEIELAVPGALAYTDARRSVFARLARWAGRGRDHDLAAPEKPGVERVGSRPEQDDGGGHQGDEDRGGRATEDVGDGHRQ